jgi:hypothetical protein
MGRIIQMPSDGHREIQSLLPWYMSGALDESERAKVRAHLNQCAECQAELEQEYRLGSQVADLPLDADGLDVQHGWALIGRALEQERPAGAPFAVRLRGLFTGRPGGTRPHRQPASWLGWAVAAQFCLLMVMGGVLWRGEQPARYHALAAAPKSTVGNVVVVFRPETREKDLRQILWSNHARLVDGPTSADAYVLHVAPADRPAVVVRLRRQAEVVLAEPVDGG